MMVSYISASVLPSVPITKIQQDPVLAHDMGIDSESRVLVIGTEGNTDAEMYDTIIAGAL